MESNSFAVRGTLDMLVNNSITTQQAGEIVNMWIELTAKRFYAEGMLDGKRSKVQRHTAEEWAVIKDLGM